jgi:putative ABC transport system permease protein
MIAHTIVHLARISQKNRLYTAIHLFGLTVGLAACLLIALFVQHETAYDKNWPGAERIFQLRTKFTVPGREPLTANTGMGPAKAALVQERPEIEVAARITAMTATLTRNDGQEKLAIEDDISFVDPEFFDLFPQHVIAGEIAAYRNDVNALMVTKPFAEKIFGEVSPIGKTLDVKIDEFKKTYRIVAVIEDAPVESHLTWRAFAFIHEPDFAHAPWLFATWTSLNAMTYVKIREGTLIDALDAAMPEMINRHMAEVVLGDPDKKASDIAELSFTNIRDVHLHSTGRGELKPAGDYRTVIALSAVAALILSIACINFINLSTARATRRAKEISLRKVLGASRKSLFGQLMMESVVLSVGALILAFCLVELTGSHVGEWMNRTLNTNFLTQPEFLATGIGLALLVGLIGGLYPAIVISGFRPVRVLKSSYSSEARGQARLRAALVVIQFVISSALMICTGVLFAQTIFARSVDLGFKKDEIITVKGMSTASRESISTFVENIAKIPGVVAVSQTGFAPFDDQENNSLYRKLGGSDQDNALIGVRPIDDRFLETYDIPLVFGRNLDRNRGSDSFPSDEEAEKAAGPIETAAILNVSALRRLGFATPEEAVGQRIEATGFRSEGGNGGVVIEIAGVIPDVHFESLRRTLRPEIYMFAKNRIDSAAIRTSPENFSAVSAAVGELWREHFGLEPLHLDIVATKVAASYDGEERLARLFAVGALIAIALACLGLFGLASFVAQRRTKEIGLRKVMGARTRDIVRLLIQQFSKPVLVANVIACPLALYAMSRWLEGFQYRIELDTVGGSLSVASLVLNLGVAWATVGFHTWMVATANPIGALRSE